MKLRVDILSDMLCSIHYHIKLFVHSHNSFYKVYGTIGPSYVFPSLSVYFYSVFRVSDRAGPSVAVPLRHIGVHKLQVRLDVTQKGGEVDHCAVPECKASNYTSKASAACCRYVLQQKCTTRVI